MKARDLTDLNKHAVTTSKSLNTLYESKDPVALITKNVVNSISFLRKYECGKRDLDCYVSVGGLDSITLFFFLKSIGIDVPAVSVSSLEDVSIQKIHKQIGVISLPPAVRTDGTRWNKQKLIQEFGFPVLSKDLSQTRRCEHEK